MVECGRLHVEEFLAGAAMMDANRPPRRLTTMSGQTIETALARTFAAHEQTATQVPSVEGSVPWTSWRYRVVSRISTRATRHLPILGTRAEFNRKAQGREDTAGARGSSSSCTSSPASWAVGGCRRKNYGAAARCCQSLDGCESSSAALIVASPVHHNEGIARLQGPELSYNAQRGSASPGVAPPG